VQGAQTPERDELLRVCESLADYEVGTALKILRGLDRR
jgi:hypothetical protein